MKRPLPSHQVIVPVVLLKADSPACTPVPPGGKNGDGAGTGVGEGTGGGEGLSVTA